MSIRALQRTIHFQMLCHTCHQIVSILLLTTQVMLVVWLPLLNLIFVDSVDKIIISEMCALLVGLIVSSVNTKDILGPTDDCGREDPDFHTIVFLNMLPNQ